LNTLQFILAIGATTRSGLLLRVPAEGAQCWGMQLPCTPYPQDNLRLRRKGDIAGGFVLDGPVTVPPTGNVGTEDP
jgi:hypothetical protein